MTDVVVIGGPTASGKSSLAVAVAQDLDGVIINADSLQLYRDLGILTAQPSAAELASAPHALYAIADANDRYDAMRWRSAAIDAITHAQAQGRVPVIVGGTGFYLKALMQGLSPVPQVSAAYRMQAQDFYAHHGLDALVQEVARCDAAIMTRIDTANPQRLMRAYEVYLATGQPLSHWQSLPASGPPPGLRFFTVVIDPPRTQMHAAIERRLGQMIAEGAQEQVADFKSRIANGAVVPDSPLVHACGYRALSDEIDRLCTHAQALEALLADTRHYAKRQQTWFRRQIDADLRQTQAQCGKVLDAFRHWRAATP